MEGDQVSTRKGKDDHFPPSLPPSFSTCRHFCFPLYFVQEPSHGVVELRNKKGKTASVRHADDWREGGREGGKRR